MQSDQCLLEGFFFTMINDGKIFIKCDSLCNRKSPTNSATSAPSKAPIVTSNEGSCFLTQTLPFRNKNDRLAMNTSSSSCFGILTMDLAHSKDFFSILVVP